MFNYCIGIACCLLTVSCSQEKKDRTGQNQDFSPKASVMNSYEKITKEKLKETNWKDARLRFDQPIKVRNFKLGEDPSEFIISLRNYFSEKEVMEKSIPITEATWKLDNSNNITAWFRADKNEKPIDVFIWNKDAEF